MSRMDKQLLKNAPKLPMPSGWQPMLATLTKEPFDLDDWTYEVKWDGYRVLAYIQKKTVRLFSRSLLDYTKQYPAVVKALEATGHEAIIDGEVVLINEKGIPDFDALQSYKGQKGIAYYAFDLLWLDGYSLIDLPLMQRKQLLKTVVKENDHVRISETFDNGSELYARVKALGLEGILAKKKDSSYSPGKRAASWMKVPTSKRQEFVIGGWTESDQARPFRSLLFGHYENGRLHYVGHAGGGYKEKEMPAIYEKLKKLETKKNPFANDVDIDHTIHWVKPQLVAEIKYATFTKGGKIRKPAIFTGFRKDKRPEEVIRDQPVTAPVTSPDKNNIIQPVKGSNWWLIKQEIVESASTVAIDGREIALTNIERELWDKVTKASLIEYYHHMAPYLLPHVKDRPLSLHVKNKGPLQPGFYIKDMEGQQPSFSTVFPVTRKHKKEGRRNIIDYLVCQEEATLLFTINLGCIDVNPWTSRITDPHHPDYIVIDLDPSDNDFSKVIATALAAQTVFKKHDLKAFPKTSGKTGMHLYIPCTGITFKQARTIAEKICEEIHSLVPDVTTTEVSIDRRGNKVYIDPNQNDEADTLAAPYSVRPHYLPTVSAPLEWKEINNDLDPHDFTLFSIQQRVEKKGDLFKKVLDPSLQKKNTKQLLKFLQQG